jgi:polyhydroxybutyrate depolymerase
MLLHQIVRWVPSMRLSYVTLLAIASIVCVGGGPPARAEEIRFDTKDGTRSAVVLRARRRPAPTVMVLHGAGGSPERVQHRFGFAEAAARHGFAAVFPQGLNRQWNDGREFRRSGVDDVGFLKRLALTLVSSGLADAAHLYIAGVSNGGMMTFRMLCEWVELFAGAATIVANMPEEVGDNCRIEKPLPVIMFNGTADPVVPYAGGGVGFRGRRGNVWAAERTAAFLAHSNGCREASKMPLPGDRPATDAVKVVRLDWSACESGSSVALYRVEGGGHQVFGRGEAFTAILGRGTSQVSAPATILAAFAAIEKGAQWNRASSRGGPAKQSP